MPKIPDYTSQAVVQPPASPPLVSDQAAAMPWLEMSRTASHAEKAATMFASRLYEADQASTLSKSMADASIAMATLRTEFMASPEFNLKPEGTVQVYQDKLKQLGQTLAAKIQDAPARGLFTDHYNKLAASHSVQFIGDARKAKVNLIQGATLNSIDKFTQAAAIAANDDIFKQNLGYMESALAGAVASGAIEADKAEALRQTAIRTALRSRAELGLVSNPVQVAHDIANRTGIYKDLPELDRANLSLQAEHRLKYLENQGKGLATGNAYKMVWDTFQLGNPGADIAGALQYVRNPSNWPLLGLTEKQELEEADKIGTMLYTEHSRLQNLIQEKTKTATEKYNQTAFDKFVTGQLSVDEINNAKITIDGKDQPLDLQHKTHWLSAVTAQSRAEERPNHELESQVLSRIWDNTITDVSQLVPLLARGGLSAGQAIKMKSAIAEHINPDKSPFFKEAMKTFDLTFKGKSELFEMRAEFMSLLDWHVKNDNEGKGLKGSEITDKARELMTKQGNNFVSRWMNDYPFQKEVEETPWRTDQRRNAPAVPSDTDAMIRGIVGSAKDPEERKEMARQLRGKGIDPTRYGLE